MSQTPDELDEVMDYVKGQLTGFGIRFPKLFPLTSKGALAEKIQPGTFSHTFLPNSGMNKFQQSFDDFIAHELTNLAIEAAEAALYRCEDLLVEVIAASKNTDKEAKRRAIGVLKYRISIYC